MADRATRVSLAGAGASGVCRQACRLITINALSNSRAAVQDGDAYVFGNEVGERVKDLKRSWRALCQRAGCDDLNFHDLRRECASRWFEGIGPERRGRMPLATVSRLLGHTSIETTFIYLGVKDEALPDDVQRFEEERNRFARVSHTEVNGLSASAKPELAVH